MTPQALSTAIGPWLTFLAADPVLRSMQLSMLTIAVLMVFLVFYTARDILLRTHSFLFMAVCILLVALLPVVGFLLYLLIRPTRTIRERELESMVRQLLLAVVPVSTRLKKAMQKEADDKSEPS